MRINKSKTYASRTIRHYKRSLFAVVATAGLLGGLVAQTGVSILQQHNAFAAAGWNWVTEQGSDGYGDGYMGYTQAKVSTDGVHVVWPRQNGLYISTNNGATYTPRHPDGQENTFYDVVGVSANGSHISAFDTNSNAAYRSSDGGATWQQMTDVNDDASQTYTFISNDGQLIVDSNYYSSDGGQTWTDSGYYIQRVSADGQTFLAQDESDPSIAWISANAGQSWHQPTTPPGGGGSVDMADDGTKIVDGGYLSNDGGATWNLVSTENVFISRNGNTLVAPADYGGQALMVSTDDGATWQPSVTLPYYPGEGLYNGNFTISSDGQHWSYSDFWVYYTSDDSGATWQASINPKGVQLAGISQDGSKLYGVTSRGGVRGAFPVSSTDNGLTWTSMYGTAIATMPAAFSQCVDYDQKIEMSKDGSLILIRAHQVSDPSSPCSIISNDGGKTWFNSSEFDAMGSTVEMSPNGRHVVARNWNNTPDADLYVSNDGMETWTHYSAQTLNALDAVSNDGQKILASNGTSHYLSTNGGQSWTDIGAVIHTAFPDYSSSRWHANISGDGSRIVASDNSYLYRSTDNGVTWQRIEFSSGYYDTSSPEVLFAPINLSDDGMKVAYTNDRSQLMTSVDGGVTFTAQNNFGGRTSWALQLAGISADGRVMVSATEDGYIGVAYYGFTPQGVTGVGAISDEESVTVSWNPATLIDPGDPVTAYEVQYRTAPNGTWVSASQTISSSATTYKVTGLTAGQQYEFRVRAHSAAGGWTNWARALEPYNQIVLSDIEAASGQIQEWAPYVAANDVGDIVFFRTVTGGQVIEQSSDNGLTWHQNAMTGVGPVVAEDASSLRISADGQVIAFITDDGVVVSDDAGLTWTLHSLAGTNNWSVQMDMSDSGKRLAVYANGDIHLSSDSGQSWTPTTTLPQGVVDEDLQYLNILNDGTLYTSSDNNSDDTPSVYVTHNNGATWTDISVTIPGGVHNQTPNGYRDVTTFFLVNVSQDGLHMVAQVVEWGGEPNYITTSDGGATWATLTSLEDTHIVGPELFNQDTLPMYQYSYGYDAGYTPSGNLVYLTAVYDNADDPDPTYSVVLTKPMTSFATPLAKVVVPPQNTPGTTPSTTPGATPTPHTTATTTTPAGDVAATTETPNPASSDTTTNITKSTGATPKSDATPIPGIPATGVPWWKDWVVVSWILAIIAALIATIIWALIARSRRKKRQLGTF